MILNVGYLQASYIPAVADADLVRKTSEKLKASRENGAEGDFHARMLFLPTTPTDDERAKPMRIITLSEADAKDWGAENCLLLWTYSLSVLDVYRCNDVFRTAMRKCVQFCTTNWLKLQTAGQGKYSVHPENDLLPTLDITSHMKRDLPVKIQVSKGKKLFVTATPDPGCVSNMMPVYEENGIVFDHEHKVVKRTEAILGFYDNEALIYPSAHTLHWCMLAAPRPPQGTRIQLSVALHYDDTEFERPPPPSKHVLQELWRSNWMAFEFKWKYVNTFSCPYLGNGWARYAELLHFMRSQFVEGRWYPMAALFDFHRDALEFCLVSTKVFKLDFRATLPITVAPVQETPEDDIAIFPGNEGVRFLVTPKGGKGTLSADDTPQEKTARLDWFGGANINTDVSLPISFINPQRAKRKGENLGADMSDEDDVVDDADEDMDAADDRSSSKTVPYEILRGVPLPNDVVVKKKKHTSVVLVKPVSSTSTAHKASEGFGVRGRLPWPRLRDYSAIGSRRILQASDHVCALHAKCEELHPFLPPPSATPLSQPPPGAIPGSKRGRDEPTTEGGANPGVGKHGAGKREDGTRACDILCLVAAYEDFLGKPSYKYKEHTADHVLPANFANDYASLDTALLQNEGFLHAEHHASGADKRILVRMGTSIHEIDVEKVISMEALHAAGCSVLKEAALSKNADPHEKAQRVVDICCTRAMGVPQEPYQPHLTTCLPRGAAGRGRSLVFVDTDIKDLFVEGLRSAAAQALQTQNVRIRVVVLDNNASHTASCDAFYATKNQYQSDTLYDGSSRMLYNDKTWHTLLKGKLDASSPPSSSSSSSSSFSSNALSVPDIQRACIMSEHQAKRVQACFEAEGSKGISASFETLMQTLAALGIDKTYEPCVCLFVAEVGPNASPNWGQGLDMLMTTGMFVADPCTSLTLYRQMIGRATRVCAFNRQSDYSYTGCDATAFYVVLLATKDEGDKERLRCPSSDFLNITNLLNEARADTLPTLLTASYNNVKGIKQGTQQQQQGSGSGGATSAKRYYVKNLMQELPTSMRWETRPFPALQTAGDPPDERDENVSRVTDRLFIGANPTHDRDYTLVPIRSKEDLRNCLLLYCRWHKVSGPSDPREDNVLHDIVRFVAPNAGTNAPLRFESSSRFTYTKESVPNTAAPGSAASSSSQSQCLKNLVSIPNPTPEFSTAEDEILHTELTYALTHYATCSHSVSASAPYASLKLRWPAYWRAKESADNGLGVDIRQLKLSDCQSVQFDARQDHKRQRVLEVEHSDRTAELLLTSIDLAFMVDAVSLQNSPPTHPNSVFVQESLLRTYKTFRSGNYIHHAVSLEVGNFAMIWKRVYERELTGWKLHSDTFFQEGTLDYEHNKHQIEKLQKATDNPHSPFHYNAGVGFDRAFLSSGDRIVETQYEVARHNPSARAWFLCDVKDKSACAQGGYGHVDVISPLAHTGDAVDYASVSEITVFSVKENFKVHKTPTYEKAFLRVAVASQTTTHSSWQSITSMPHLWELPLPAVRPVQKAQLSGNNEVDVKMLDETVSSGLSSMITDYTVAADNHFNVYKSVFEKLNEHFNKTAKIPDQPSLGDPFCASSFKVKSYKAFMEASVQVGRLEKLKTTPPTLESFTSSNDPLHVMSALAFAAAKLASHDAGRTLEQEMRDVVNLFYTQIGVDADATRLSLRLLTENLRLLAGDVYGFGVFDPQTFAVTKITTKSDAEQTTQPQPQPQLYWHFFSMFKTKAWDGDGTFQISSDFAETATLMVKVPRSSAVPTPITPITPTAEAATFKVGEDEYQIEIPRTRQCLFHLCMVFRHVKNISSNSFRLLKEVKAVEEGKTRKVVLGNFVYVSSNTYRLALTPSIDIDKHDAELYQKSGHVELRLETTPFRGWVIRGASAEYKKQETNDSESSSCMPFGAYTTDATASLNTAHSSHILHVEWFKHDSEDTSTHQCVKNFLTAWPGVTFERLIRLLSIECLDVQRTEGSKGPGPEELKCFSTSIATSLILDSIVRVRESSNFNVEEANALRAALNRYDFKGLHVEQTLRAVRAWRTATMATSKTSAEDEGKCDADVEDQHTYLRRYISDAFASLREASIEELLTEVEDPNSLLVSYKNFPWNGHKFYQIGATNEDNFFRFMQTVMNDEMRRGKSEGQPRPKFFEFLEKLAPPPKPSISKSLAGQAKPEQWVWQKESLKLLYEYEGHINTRNSLIHLDNLMLSRVRSDAQGSAGVEDKEGRLDQMMIQGISDSTEEGRRLLESIPKRDGLHVAYLSCTPEPPGEPFKRKCWHVLLSAKQTRQNIIRENRRQGKAVATEITEVERKRIESDIHKLLLPERSLSPENKEDHLKHYMKQYESLIHNNTKYSPLFVRQSYTITYYKNCARAGGIQPTLSAVITILMNTMQDKKMKLVIKGGDGKQLFGSTTDVMCREQISGLTHADAYLFDLTQIVAACGWYEVASFVQHSRDTAQCPDPTMKQDKKFHMIFPPNGGMMDTS